MRGDRSGVAGGSSMTLAVVNSMLMTEENNKR